MQSKTDGISVETQRLKSKLKDYCSLITLKEAIKLCDIVKEIQGKGMIVELGAAYGGTTTILAETAKNSTVIAVDNYVDSENAKSFLDNVRQSKMNNIRLLISTSLDAAPIVPNEIDLLFADTVHDYDYLKNELVLWEPKIKVGGYLAIHDVLPTSALTGLNMKHDIKCDQRNGSVRSQAVIKELLATERYEEVEYVDSLFVAKKKFHTVRRSISAVSNFQPSVVMVVPFGIKEHVEILELYLKRNLKKNGGLVDRVTFLENTNHVNNLEYLQELVEKEECYDILRPFDHDGIIQDGPLIGEGKRVIRLLERCTDHGVIYVKCDDDIIYIHDEAIENIVKFLLTNEFPFVQGNIINHCRCSFLHQTKSGLYANYDKFEYDAFGRNCWRNPQPAKFVHKTFFKLFEEERVEDYFFEDWVYNQRERWSICFMAFQGDVMEQACRLDKGAFNRDHEVYLTEEYPSKKKTKTAICGNSLVSHYAYHTQRSELNKDTSLLKNYLDIAKTVQTKPPLSCSIM